MGSKAELVDGWLRMADDDLQTVRALLDNQSSYKAACFHAQQAAEKYLKALLTHIHDSAPRTHDLEELSAVCAEYAAKLAQTWDIDQSEVAVLTSYAVETRYQMDFWPDERVAQAALGTAEKVREAVIANLPQDSHTEST